MRLIYSTVEKIIDNDNRIILCSSDEGHGEYIAEVLFSHHNIEPGDKMLLLVVSSTGSTTNYAVPFSKKNNNTFDNIKIFFTPDTIIEMNKDSINIQKSYPKDSGQSEESGDNEDDSNNNQKDEEEKENNYIYIDQHTIIVNKSKRARIALSDDDIVIKKHNKDEEIQAEVSITDNQITINKGEDTQIVIDDDNFQVSVKNIKLLSSSGGEVEVPGMPQASSTSTGGFSQILHCPFTGLPHNTPKLTGQ